MTKSKYVTKIFNVTLDNGMHVQFLANVKTGLIVVDIVDEDESGGVEVLRIYAGEHAE